jgi:hypothetical protein
VETRAYDQPEPTRGLQRVAIAMLVALAVLGGAIILVMLTLGGRPSDSAVAVASPSLDPTTSPSPQPSMTPWPTAEPTLAITPMPTLAPTPEPTLTPTPSPITTLVPASEPPKTPPAATPTPTPDANASPTPIRPVDGDRLASPIVLTAVPASVTLDTTHATSEPFDPDCSGTGPTVWFTFRPTESVTLAANTFGSNYDTTLYLATRNQSGTIELLACNDDAGDDVQSAIRFDAQAGTNYYFMVGAFSAGPGGQLVFNLDHATPLPQLSISVLADGTFDADGRATLYGTATCSSRVDNLYIDVSLRQLVGRQVFRGWGEAYLERCGTRERSWSVVVSSYDGTFGDEPATATVYASICDDFECRSVQLEVNVTLHSSVSPPSPSPTPSPSPSPSPSPTHSTEPGTEPQP